MNNRATINNQGLEQIEIHGFPSLQSKKRQKVLIKDQRLPIEIFLFVLVCCSVQMFCLQLRVKSNSIENFQLGYRQSRRHNQEVL
jgi:hypothetical protein